MCETFEFYKLGWPNILPHEILKPYSKKISFLCKKILQSTALTKFKCTQNMSGFTVVHQNIYCLLLVDHIAHIIWYDPLWPLPNTCTSRLDRNNHITAVCMQLNCQIVLVHSQSPHVVTMLWQDSDDAVAILSSTSGTGYWLQNQVSLPPWFVQSDCVLLGA